MTKITHPSMRSAKPSAVAKATKQETFVVGDASGGPQKEPAPSAIDEHLKQFEKPKAPIPQYADGDTKFPVPQKTAEEKKQSIERLIFMGRDTKVVEAAGHKFELSTMTHREHNEIVKMLYSFGDAADLFTVRILTLANVLRKIDDMPIDEIDIDGEFESAYQRRISIIDHLQVALVTKLHEEYEKLIAENNKLLEGNEEIKN